MATRKSSAPSPDGPTVGHVSNVPFTPLDGLEFRAALYGAPAEDDEPKAASSAFGETVSRVMSAHSVDIA
jgi:hypothetical protein